MMNNEINGLLAHVVSAEEHAAREAALSAAHEVQDEMDALCMQIKQLLAVSYTIKVEQDSLGRCVL